MNLIAELVALGARELVAVIASEPAAARAWRPGSRGRSPLSRGIAAIRRAFPELTAGARGYDAARQVFRQQVRRAVQAREAMTRGDDSPPRSNPPRSPRTPRTPPPDRTYTMRVELTSQRGAKSTWRIVYVHGPDGLSLSELRRLATAAVDDLLTSSGKYVTLGEWLGDRRRIGQIQWIG